MSAQPTYTITTALGVISAQLVEQAVAITLPVRPHFSATLTFTLDEAQAVSKLIRANLIAPRVAGEWHNNRLPGSTAIKTADWMQLVSVRRRNGDDEVMASDGEEIHIELLDYTKRSSSRFLVSVVLTLADAGALAAALAVLSTGRASPPDAPQALPARFAQEFGTHVAPITSDWPGEIEAIAQANTRRDAQRGNTTLDDALEHAA